MRGMAGVFLALLVVLAMVAVRVPRAGASNDFETLEFFLDQSLQRTKDHAERSEILNRYLIKALGLVYEQNQELIRLNRETLKTLEELREIEGKEARELEIQLQKR